MPYRDPDQHSLPPVLPVGTAVVLRSELRAESGASVHPAGAAALVVRSPVEPSHAYTLRFPGGDECEVAGDVASLVLQPLGSFQASSAGGGRSDIDDHALRGLIVYRCVIGSRAYGLDRGSSDTDRRGIYLPTARMHWSVFGVPEQLEDPAAQECYWEVGKFIRLGLKANPNVLETLWTPLVEHVDPIVKPLLDEREIFLSKLIFQTFNGYALSQFRKMEQDIRTTGEVKWKHAMHLIRVLLAGVAALRTERLDLRVGDRRDELLAIRDGLVPWNRVDAIRRALHEDFQRAFVASRLPETPNFGRANEILIAIRAEVARRETA
jgi:hypothetical protein